MITFTDFCLKWSLLYHLYGWVVTVGNKPGSHLRSSQPKAPFPPEMTSGDACRYSILMTRHYPDQIWVVLLIGQTKFKNWCNSTLIFISFAIERFSSGPDQVKSCVTLLNTNVLARVQPLSWIKSNTSRILGRKKEQEGQYVNHHDKKLHVVWRKAWNNAIRRP